MANIIKYSNRCVSKHEFIWCPLLINFIYFYILELNLCCCIVQVSFRIRWRWPNNMRCISRLCLFKRIWIGRCCIIDTFPASFGFCVFMGTLLRRIEYIISLIFRIIWGMFSHIIKWHKDIALICDFIFITWLHTLWTEYLLVTNCMSSSLNVQLRNIASKCSLIALKVLQLFVNWRIGLFLLLGRRPLIKWTFISCTSR